MITTIGNVFLPATVDNTDPGPASELVDIPAGCDYAIVNLGGWPDGRPFSVEPITIDGVTGTLLGGAIREVTTFSGPESRIYGFLLGPGNVGTGKTLAWVNSHNISFGGAVHVQFLANVKRTSNLVDAQADGINSAGQSLNVTVNTESGGYLYAGANSDSSGFSWSNVSQIGILQGLGDTRLGTAEVVNTTGSSVNVGMSGNYPSLGVVTLRQATEVVAQTDLGTILAPATPTPTSRQVSLGITLTPEAAQQVTVSTALGISLGVQKTAFTDLGMVLTPEPTPIAITTGLGVSLTPATGIPISRQVALGVSLLPAIAAPINVQTQLGCALAPSAVTPISVSTGLGVSLDSGTPQSAQTDLGVSLIPAVASQVSVQTGLGISLAPVTYSQISETTGLGMTLTSPPSSSVSEQISLGVSLRPPASQSVQTGLGVTLDLPGQETAQCGLGMTLVPSVLVADAVRMMQGRTVIILN